MAIRILALSLAFLIVAVFTPLAEAGENRMVSFKPAWMVNETVKYMVKRTKTNNEKVQSATMTLTVRVVEKTVDGYIFECQYDDFETDIDLPAESMHVLAGMTRGVKCKYATDKYGAFMKIVNIDEIRAWTEASFAQFVASIPDEVVRAGVSKHISDYIKTEGAVSASASKDIAYLHNPYFLGQEFEAGEKYMMEVTMPNILNPPQPYLGVVFMTASRGGGSKQMLIEQEIDKQKSADILSDTLRKMAVTYNVRQPDANFKFTNVELKDTFHYFFNEFGNWAEKASITRKIIVDGIIREETIEFIRQE